MTHPGVGALTALAFVLIMGRADRFQCGKQVACYLGLVPLEESSGDRRRLGHITKQGNSLLRFLLVEAAQVTVRSIPEWRSKYFHLAMRRGRKIAKVAMARSSVRRVENPGSHAGVPTASTWYPRLRSSRIIRFVRLRLDFAFTAGPRSS
jgi:transposase